MDLKEALKKLGIELNEDQLKQVEELNENWIPKTRFDEVNNKFKEQQTMVAERDEQIKKLGESATSVEEYQKQIALLTESNQKANEEWSAKYKSLSQQSAFNSSVSKYHFKEKFLKQVNGMIDTEKLIENDGVWGGFDEQLSKIAEDYPEFVDNTNSLSNVGSDHNPNGVNGTSAKENEYRRLMGIKPKN